MTAYEIYRVRLALTKRAKDAEKQEAVNQMVAMTEIAEKEAAAEKYQAARETLRMYDSFRF